MLGNIVQCVYSDKLQYKNVMEQCTQEHLRMIIQETLKDTETKQMSFKTGEMQMKKS